MASKLGFCCTNHGQSIRASQKLVHGWIQYSGGADFSGSRIASSARRSTRKPCRQMPFWHPRLMVTSQVVQQSLHVGARSRTRSHYLLSCTAIHPTSRASICMECRFLLPDRPCQEDEYLTNPVVTGHDLLSHVIAQVVNVQHCPGKDVTTKNPSSLTHTPRWYFRRTWRASLSKLLASSSHTRPPAAGGSRRRPFSSRSATG